MKHVIGITGGVGSGKSRILSILKERYDADVILADLVAAELEEPGQPGLLALVERFGTGILSPEGTLDRAAFAAKIFSDPQALSDVNAIIHPLTWTEIERRAEASPKAIVVVESALFDEEHKPICDTLWFVDTDEAVRIARLKEGRGYTEEKCRSVMSRQKSREEFLSLSDAVIDNNGTPEEVETQICALIDALSEVRP